MEEFKDAKSILMMSEEMLEAKLEAIYQRALKEHKQLPEIIDGDDAQGILKIGTTSLYKLRVSGAIPHYKMGGTIVYKRSEILAYINEHKQDKF